MAIISATDEAVQHLFDLYEEAVERNSGASLNIYGDVSRLADTLEEHDAGSVLSQDDQAAVNAMGFRLRHASGMVGD